MVVDAKKYTTKITFNVEFVTDESPYKTAELLYAIAEFINDINTAIDQGMQLTAFIDYETDFKSDMTLVIE